MIYSMVKDSCETHDDANEDKLTGMTGILLHVAISASQQCLPLASV